LIRYYPAPPEKQLRVQDRIRFQLELLESGAARPVSDFDALSRQTCFGDFHERQVMFRDDGTVAAVVDWEGLGWASPMWELVRSLTVSGMLPFERLRAYLRGYASNMRIRGDEAALAVEAQWQFMLHDTWSLTTRFIQGDRRPQRFFASEAEHLRMFADERFRNRLTANLRSATVR
jgi:thiamine kinase-like enzyme